MTGVRRFVTLGVVLALGTPLVACDGGSAHPSRGGAGSASTLAPLPGVAPGHVPAHDVYAATRADMFSAAAAGVPERVYVPNSKGATLDVIDPRSFKVVASYPVGRVPQHVVPSWDLSRLYVTDDASNDLTPIDPRSAKPAGPRIPVDDPYNLYFTPDGLRAIVVAEARGRLDFRDAHTFALMKALPVRCRGVDHLDFAADGSYLVASCEFSGLLVKVDLRSEAVVGYLHVGGMPQDVRLDPSGDIFYVADMKLGGVHEVAAETFTEVGFVPTGPEAHGLVLSRDGRFFYVANRGGPKNKGSVSVLDVLSRQVVATWVVPGGGTPDMGGVSDDGRVLWVSGRRSRVVYAFDTETGRLLARIPVGPEPHGVCVWPQPGRFSVGHTDNLR